MTDSINFHTMLEGQQDCINISHPQTLELDFYETSPVYQMNGGGKKDIEFNSNIKNDYKKYLSQFEEFIKESKKHKDNITQV